MRTVLGKSWFYFENDAVVMRELNKKIRQDLKKGRRVVVELRVEDEVKEGKR